MSVKHKLFRGAAILTAAGFISRIMGFFFRIFLSHAFGEENVGLYQLIFPVYSFCLSLSTAGIQTAVSRITAEKVSLGSRLRPWLCGHLRPKQDRWKRHHRGLCHHHCRVRSWQCPYFRERQALCQFRNRRHPRGHGGSHGLR